MADRSTGERSISVLGRVRGEVILDVLFLLRPILVIVNSRLALTGAGDAGRVLVFPGSVHHGVKSILVRPITDHPNATVRFLHAVLAGHVAPCARKEKREPSFDYNRTTKLCRCVLRFSSRLILKNNPTVLMDYWNILRLESNFNFASSERVAGLPSGCSRMLVRLETLFSRLSLKTSWTAWIYTTINIYNCSNSNKISLMRLSRQVPFRRGAIDEYITRANGGSKITILNYLSLCLSPGHVFAIRDHVNYTLRSSCLRFPATVVPETKFETKRALKGEAERSSQRKCRTFLWRMVEKKLEREKEI